MIVINLFIIYCINILLKYSWEVKRLKVFIIVLEMIYYFKFIKFFFDIFKCGDGGGVSGVMFLFFNLFLMG